MQIKTKYNVGDKVFALDMTVQYLECKACGNKKSLPKYYIVGNGKVNTITIMSFISHDEKTRKPYLYTNIEYHIEKFGVKEEDKYSLETTIISKESETFKTRKRAQKEVDKRNKEVLKEKEEKEKECLGQMNTK